MADDDVYERKLRESFRLVKPAGSNSQWEVRWEVPIPVWIDGALTWEVLE